MTPVNDRQCHWRTLDGSRHQGVSFFGRQLFNDTVGVIYLRKTRFLKCPLMERGKIFKSCTFAERVWRSGMHPKEKCHSFLENNDTYCHFRGWCHLRGVILPPPFLLVKRRLVQFYRPWQLDEGSQALHFIASKMNSLEYTYTGKILLINCTT
jgi:hypothetical protein